MFLLHCNILFYSIVICVLQIASASFMQHEIEYDGQLSISLQHALNNEAEGSFTDRGTVVIHSIRTGSVVMNQNPLSTEEQAKLKKLKDNDGLYRLRSIVTTLSGQKFSFLTFTKACALYESRLSDVLTVSLDHAGNPVAVSMASSPGLGEPVSPRDLQNFNTTVFVRHMEQGPTPDTTAYIQKLEKEKEERARGETKDNRGFFAKYWMYIVPVVIFVMLSSAANPEAAGGGGR